MKKIKIVGRKINVERVALVRPAARKIYLGDNNLEGIDQRRMSEWWWAKYSDTVVCLNQLYDQLGVSHLSPEDNELFDRYGHLNNYHRDQALLTYVTDRFFMKAEYLLFMYVEQAVDRKRFQSNTTIYIPSQWSTNILDLVANYGIIKVDMEILGDNKDIFVHQGTNYLGESIRLGQGMKGWLPTNERIKSFNTVLTHH